MIKARAGHRTYIRIGLDSLFKMASAIVETAEPKTNAFQQNPS